MAIARDEDMLNKELDFQREMADRQAVASGNVDKNSALYRHAKLNGWAIGSKEPFHGQAGRKWWAAEQAAKGRMMDAQADIMEADADLRAGYDGIVANATAQRLDRARRGRATLGSIVGHAMSNGGMVPRELAQSVGMELGDPGFVGGTLAKDGTFMSLGRGKKGDIQPTGLVSPMDVTKAMVDSGNWRDAQKYVKQFLKGRLTDQQIESATGYSDLWAQQTAAKDRQRRSVEIEKVVLDGIRDMLKEKPDMTPGEAWRSLVKNNPKALESYLTRPATDEEVNNGAADENGNVSLSPEEGFRKFESLWNLGKSGGAAAEQSGNPRLDQIGALLDRLEKMNAPAPADPNAVEMRQRANARANVIDAAGGRQQRILEVLPDGRLAETSGYVANGKVYDANGDERQGQFLDENRRPIVPAAQPAQGQGQISQADAAAELARRKAARAGQAQGGAASGAVGDMAKPVTTLGEGAQAGAVAGEESSAQPDPEESQVEFPEDSPERQARRNRQRESTLRQAGVDEGVAQHYDSIDRETMRRFREAVPDATMADIYSGKYDREIASAANLADDTSTPSVIKQAQALRSEYKSAQRGKAVKAAQDRFDEEYSSGMDAIRKEADARAIRGNWSKQERDNYIKREEFMLKNRLRKRLVNAEQAMS